MKMFSKKRLDTEISSLSPLTLHLTNNLGSVVIYHVRSIRLEVRGDESVISIVPNVSDEDLAHGVLVPGAETDVILDVDVKAATRVSIECVSESRKSTTTSLTSALIPS